MPHRMYKTWTASHDDAETVARDLEVHLNEYAEEVISVAYSVDHRHHVLAVYRAIGPATEAQHEAAVSVAEQILDDAQL